MGSGASGFKSEEEALKAGKTQEEIDAWKKANAKPRLLYFNVTGRGQVVLINPTTGCLLGNDSNKPLLCRFAS